MKLLTLLLTLLTLTTYAQTKIYVPGGTDSGVVNNTSNDNVGIGISVPTVKLHVNGDIRGSNTIVVENNGSYRVALNATADGFVAGRNEAAQKMFFINSNGTSFFNGGKVGIGTETPSATLHVIGNFRTSAQINGSEYVSVDRDGSYRVSMNGQADGYITGRDDQLVQKFLINSNGNSFFNGGNVGVGTSSPSATLHVAGNLRTTDRINGAEYVSVDRNGSYRVAMNGQGDGYLVGRDDQLEKKFLISSNGNSYLTGGNVGIGTTTPDALLTVKGQIHTQEVKVDLNGAVAPDYVFSETYQLKSLEDVKSYIQANSHLPNIPSAKEMEENGIELKEMNLKLLEKVEELTLHLIQQYEVNKDQEKEIEELKRVNAMIMDKLVRINSK
ncbi:hypothetical protein C900_05857 [Fulvivirga imtechensis AK7]|uniref:Uncharacterized protein n=1 Tax=Fulvivirga imtechensis AK7 TaxID=1237149 RepID=L8JIS5_9BACT|nr:tail fiber protein [Fulvivirga imtechensis]ELR68761.1 hypothetical protein C900_05857 [Fulvivirga imtechensis AK7]